MTKKLYKNKEDRVIGGVCAGLGEYFDVDKTIVRIIFLILFFGFGSGLLLYLILWIIMPDKTEISQ
ncbi:PspC domain-containing protein [Solitalea koreensis]|uniref:Phage shock protein C (PspC) family protein n=1 Tax=Solitalea koreensis TaxID=543615 RepID=A0A521AC55_9SPHI|nr:PspC domain-containing protein [Solitalea koreensis]SMO32352.1 phage shock protein C (PspC) family protein [Solitalea koreensis]